MLKLLNRLAIVILVTITLKAGAEIVDRIVAVVGNEVITQSELDKAYLNDELDIMKSENSTNVQISKRDYLEKMIEKMLIDQEVKRQGISVSVLEVEQAIERKREELGMSQSDFIQTLRNQGMTLEQYREKVKENMVLGKLISKEVRSEIEITEQEIQLYYQQHKNEFRTPDRIHLYHLVARKGALGKEKINKAQKEFSDGISFPELARRYSEGEEAEKGGDLGWVEIKAIKPELALIIEKLDVNQLSPVYEDEVGYHLFWIQGKEHGIEQSIDQVREKIKQILERKQFDVYYQSWLQRLKSKSYIEIRL